MKIQVRKVEQTRLTIECYPAACCEIPWCDS